MRLPRDISGQNLAKGLGRLGYAQSRQTGSHMRLTTQMEGEYHVTIPRHDPLKIGTLKSVLDGVAEHHHLTRDQLIQMLDL